MFGLKWNKYVHPLEVVDRGSETQFQVGENKMIYISVLMVNPSPSHVVAGLYLILNNSSFDMRLCTRLDSRVSDKKKQCKNITIFWSDIMFACINESRAGNGFD